MRIGSPMQGQQGAVGGARDGTAVSFDSVSTAVQPKDGHSLQQFQSSVVRAAQGFAIIYEDAGKDSSAEAKSSGQTPANATAGVAAQPQPADGLLPKICKPRLYKVSLEPKNVRKMRVNDAQTSVATGDTCFCTCSIELDILTSTNSIILHAFELEFQQVYLEMPSVVDGAIGSSCAYDASRVMSLHYPYALRVNKQKQTVEVCFSEVLSATGSIRAVLHFRCQSRIHASTYRGIFQCDFRGDVADPRVIYRGACSHFEPTDARTAFPCFDEPASKAVFELEVVVPTEFTVISNTRPIRTVPVVTNAGASLKRVQFARTPVMSPYLLCFVAGYFEVVEQQILLKSTVNGTQQLQPVSVRAFVPVGRTHEAKFALDVASRALMFFSEKFQLSYSDVGFDKLDLVTVPHLDALAMENFGCCIFRDRFFLVDEQKTSLSLKQRIARLIAHEISHQWFGNVVSIQWWQWLWMKEGFARYLEYQLVDHMFPQWEYWTHFERDIYLHALDMDEDMYTHPVEVECYSSNQIHSIFDAISYGKGACVIRMISVYLGQRILWKGLSHFVRKHRFGTATTESLWECLKEVSGIDIASVMDGWIKHSGHPVLQMRLESPEETLALDGHVDAAHDIIAVEQQLACRRGPIKNVKTDDNGNPSYIAPLIIKKYSAKTVGLTPSTPSTPSSSNSFMQQLVQIDADAPNTIHFLLNSNKARIKIPKIQPGEWIKFNWGHTGFYRVSYPRQMWMDLAAAAGRGEMPLEDQLGLLIDAFTFARQPFNSPTHLDIDVLFSLMLSMKRSGAVRNQQVWHYIVEQMESTLCLLATRTATSDQGLALFVRDMFTHLLANGEISQYGDFLNNNGNAFYKRNQVDEDLEVTGGLADWDEDPMDLDAQSPSTDDAGEQDDDSVLKARVISMLVMPPLTVQAQEQVAYCGALVRKCWRTFNRIFFAGSSAIEDGPSQSNASLVTDHHISWIERTILSCIPGDVLEIVFGVAVRGSPVAHSLVKRLLLATAESSSAESSTLSKICFLSLWFSEDIDCITDNIEFIYQASSSSGASANATSFAAQLDDFIYSLSPVLGRNAFARNALWNDTLCVAYDEIQKVCYGLEFGPQPGTSDQANPERVRALDKRSSHLRQYVCSSIPFSSRILTCGNPASRRSPQHPMYFNLLMALLSSLKQHFAPNQAELKELLQGSKLLEPLINTSALQQLFDTLQQNSVWAQESRARLSSFLLSFEREREHQKPALQIRLGMAPVVKVSNSSSSSVPSSVSISRLKGTVRR